MVFDYNNQITEKSSADTIQKDSSSTNTSPTVFTRPQPLEEITPPFPAGSRRRNEQGTAKVKVFISAEGQVLKVELITSSGYSALDNAAINAAKNARFKPATRNNKPIQGNLIIAIDFNFTDD